MCVCVNIAQTPEKNKNRRPKNRPIYIVEWRIFLESRRRVDNVNEPDNIY